MEENHAKESFCRDGYSFCGEHAAGGLCPGSHPNRGCARRAEEIESVRRFRHPDRRALGWRHPPGAEKSQGCRENRLHLHRKHRLFRRHGARAARSRRQQKPDIIFGDAFGNEEAVRRVAKDFPKIAFVFGSGGGPSDPNVSVFDNWIHEPAYLCGMLAGGLTKTGTIGVVGGYPVPEVNRLVNAFIAGAKEINPEAKVLVTFINSWFDPAAAKEAALAQIDAGADVLFAERFGVIEAAAGKGPVRLRQYERPERAGPRRGDQRPGLEHGSDRGLRHQASQGGAYTAQDLKDFSMVGKGGASLAPFHGTESQDSRRLESQGGCGMEPRSNRAFRVDIDEAAPAAVN